MRATLKCWLQCQSGQSGWPETTNREIGITRALGSNSNTNATLLRLNDCKASPTSGQQKNHQLRVRLLGGKVDKKYCEYGSQLDSKSQPQSQVLFVQKDSNYDLVESDSKIGSTVEAAV